MSARTRPLLGMALLFLAASVYLAGAWCDARREQSKAARAVTLPVGAWVRTNNDASAESAVRNAVWFRPILTWAPMTAPDDSSHHYNQHARSVLGSIHMESHTSAPPSPQNYWLWESEVRVFLDDAPSLTCQLAATVVTNSMWHTRRETVLVARVSADRHVLQFRCDVLHWDHESHEPQPTDVITAEFREIPGAQVVPESRERHAWRASTRAYERTIYESALLFAAMALLAALTERSLRRQRLATPAALPPAPYRSPTTTVEALPQTRHVSLRALRWVIPLVVIAACWRVACSRSAMQRLRPTLRAPATMTTLTLPTAPQPPESRSAP